MGWYGKYIYSKPTMREIKKLVEEETRMTCTSVKFGYAICIMTKEDIQKSREKAKTQEGDWKGYSDDIENLITIVLWRYDSKDNDIMFKNMEESVGPYIYDVPMKYLKAECKAITRKKERHEKNPDKYTYYYWREKAIDYMKKKSEIQKKIRKLKRGDIIKTKHGNVYKFTEFIYKKVIGILQNGSKCGVVGAKYSIPKNRIAEIQTI